MEGRPRHAQRLAGRCHTDPHRKRLGRHRERGARSRFNPSSPATFPCTTRIVCAACNSCSRRATCASSARTFASSGLRSAGFAPRFFEANSHSEPLRRALRQAVRCELYNPSRRSSRPTSPRCVQRSTSSRIRSRYSAVNWRRFGLATTSGSGVGLGHPALGASSLRSSAPRAE